ncbi:MAG TPA: kelch repeat-containing protein, partial [Candidatus Limnocylindria bacterium]|nr:kelch repeat-containing protein [Candidatus Limnocylindria bacterium]
TWTVDPDGTTAYLFGGRDAAGRAYDDLWAYDLATDGWRQLAADGPPARFGHNAAWVDGVGLVVFAGQSPTTFYNDLWAYDPVADRWRQLPDAGDAPVARYGSCAAVGPDGRLWISHGFTSEGSRFADTRAYDFTTQAWSDETPAGERPVERCLHGCWWTDDGRLALYAGQTTGVPALADLWQLTPGPRIGTNAWSEVTPSRSWPPERQLYAAARWGAGTVVFGGGSLGGGFRNDTWLRADDGTASRIRTGRGPAARAGAELIADPTRDRLLLFGGRDADGTMRDVWALRPPTR